MRLILTYLFAILITGNILAQEKNQITYIANEGVFLEYKGNTVFIDALHKKYIQYYQPTLGKTAIGAIQKMTPFEAVDLMLVTHVHRDHFDVAYTIQFLENHEETILVAPQQVMDSIGRIDYLTNQFYPLQATENGPVYEMEGMTIQSIPLLHAHQEKNDWVQNLGYIVDFEGLMVLHAGDAELLDENFERLKKAIGKGVDYAILPDWFFADDESIKKVAKYIKAKKYIAVHVPITIKNFHERKLKKRVEPYGLDLNVFLRIGETEPLEK